MGKRFDDATAQVGVAIVGAGPAGLVLANLLLDQGIDCVVLERRERAAVESRARAGFLAATAVETLTRNGLGDGLLARGRTHRTCLFRGERGEFTLDYSRAGRREPHTVYPQQELVRDLLTAYLRRGGDLRFGARVTRVTPGLVRLHDGDEVRARYVAGCDGHRGATRAALTARGTRTARWDHGVTWLAVLAAAGPSMAAVGYALHERGFAGHMARTDTVTRYYLQVPRGTDPADWSDDRIWTELALRMRAAEHGPLRPGAVLERTVVDLRCDVLERPGAGRLWLAGDAAGLISPSAAKGANLAVVQAATLAPALAAALAHGDSKGLDRYAEDCLPRVWRAHEFSHWMSGLLHGPAGHGPEARYGRALQYARLESLRTSRAHQDHFAENYTGV
ncbi:4-hydroxybenzoate 3-monooxygenase [Streptomyces sp. DSM 41014]|uniref:4-hydroxybenzoate 3-monooxygenase n=1 Tax=Streptomyces hintoniae TaxID=3075521 RepID=A0ABU2UDE9_9ACTN|nr:MULTISPECIES: 4-hydroxybenzoate 3-monooxygenase [unclassified Streptomyces]MDH6701788.1 p-hydroxybenzoate 3-monooxygenase [Streptomyces sp. MAA16]MDT0471193.1 4-hydroxybenzoate 3-monooxygenase [Streptomyces sp. DSM 41014]